MLPTSGGVLRLPTSSLVVLWVGASAEVRAHGARLRRGCMAGWRRPRPSWSGLKKFSRICCSKAELPAAVRRDGSGTAETLVGGTLPQAHERVPRRTRFWQRMHDQ